MPAQAMKLLGRYGVPGNLFAVWRGRFSLEHLNTDRRGVSVGSRGLRDLKRLLGVGVSAPQVFEGHPDQFCGSYEPIKTTPFLAGAPPPGSQQQQPRLGCMKKGSAQWTLGGARNFRQRMQTLYMCGIVRFVHSVTFRAGLSGFRPVLDLQTLHIFWFSQQQQPAPKACC